jgi:hypothetical protein
VQLKPLQLQIILISVCAVVTFRGLMNAHTPHNTFGITVTEVPAEKDYRSVTPRLPALDPSASPLAMERIAILETFHRTTRDSLEKLAKAEQGVLDLVQAFHAFDEFVGQKARTLFCPPAPSSLRDVMDYLAGEVSDAPDRSRLAAETLLIVHKFDPASASLNAAMKRNPHVDGLVRDALLGEFEFASVGELEPMFKEVVSAQRSKQELYSRLVHASKVTLSKLTALARSHGNPEVSQDVQEFASGVRAMVKDAEDLKTKKILSMGLGALAWGSTKPNRDNLSKLAEVGKTVLEGLRVEVTKALPELRQYESRVRRAVSGVLALEAVTSAGFLPAAEALLLQHATVNVPSHRDEFPGEPAPGVASSIARDLRSIESQQGAEMIRSAIARLEQESGKGGAWITDAQGTFLRSWVNELEAERREAQERQRNISVSTCPVVEQRAYAEPAEVSSVSNDPTSEEFLREIFGEEIATIVSDKIEELPPLQQIEERVVALEGVAGTALGARSEDLCFALVSKIVAKNPHILTAPDFGEFISKFTQTALRIEKLKLSASIYDVMVDTHRFASLTALAETNARIDMASSYLSAVNTLNEAQLPGESIMALLRYGFFFQGRLQFGVCVGEDRMVLENVDKQSPESLSRRDLEKGLTALHRAGIIERPTRGHGSFLKRAATPGTKHERPLSKALAWVIAHPDPRVEF